MALTSIVSLCLETLGSRSDVSTMKIIMSRQLAKVLVKVSNYAIHGPGHELIFILETGRVFVSIPIMKSYGWPSMSATSFLDPKVGS